MLALESSTKGSQLKFLRFFCDLAMVVAAGHIIAHKAKKDIEEA